MAEDHSINLTGHFKATADTSAFDKAVAAVEKLEGKIKGLETLQSSLSRSQQVAERARERIQEEGLKGAAAKAVLREAASAINTELGLSGRTAQQLKDAKIDPTTIANAAKTLRGFGEITETLGKLSGQVSEQTLQPLKDRLARDQGILKRALAGNAPVAGRAGFISGQEIPAGMTAAQARALESKQAPSVTTSDAEAVARSSEIRSKAAKQTAQVKENAAKVEQAVVQTIQTAAESLKQAASAASSTGPARGRIRQATGTSRIIGEALLGAGTGGAGGARAGAGAEGTRARKPFGFDEATRGATDSLNREARAARETAEAMKILASAKRQVVTGEKAVASSTGRVIDQLMKEMKAAPKAAAALHQMLRQMEAANNPRYGRGFAANNQQIYNMSRSADTARRSFVGMAGAQDSFLGQVKQVAVLATSFSILQGVASKLQEGFSHLTGGIIGFNQVLERTQVGFRRLFINQEQQVEISRGFGDMGQQVEYLAMGYETADKAAAGMVETIRQFANVTPFRFQELAQATLRMRAFGFSLDEVLYKSEDAQSGFDGAVVAIGDAVSALGGGALEFQRITYALGQMKQAGRVYQNDMMQLANAGIGGYKYIADTLREEITKNRTGQRKDVKAGYEELYDNLANNAIETVRRLTTNGEISGEAAARAIISGLKRDFGGGMDDFSKTFVGAWTTLADTSQSLVAQAFEPFYNEFVKRLYKLGQFFQSDQASQIAKSFQPLIAKISGEIFRFAGTAGLLLEKIINDVSGAFSSIGTKASQFGINSRDVFRTLRDGIGVVSGMLQNDMTRGIIAGTIAFKSLMSFAQANPMLTTISAIIFALGALKQAYDKNFLGFQTAINQLVTNITPVVQDIQRELLPLLLEIGAFVVQYIIGGLVLAFKLAKPAIEVVVNALSALLKVAKPLAPIIAGLVFALGARFGYNLIISGFSKIGFEIAKASVLMRRFGRDAAIAADQASRVATGALTTTGGVAGAYGPSTKELKSGARGPSFIGGIANRGVGLGTVGIIGASLAEMAGAPQEITSVISSVSSALMGFGVLKSLFPGSVVEGIKTGLSGVGIKLGELLARFKGTALVSNLSALGPAVTSLATAVKGISLNPLTIGLGLLAGAVVGASAAVATALRNIGQDIPEVAAAKIYHGGILEIRDALGLGKVTPNIPRPSGPLSSGFAPDKEERLERIDRYRDLRERAAQAAKDEADGTKEAQEQMDLLVKKQQQSAAEQERRNTLQEKYNRLLQQAQRSLDVSTGLLQDLAKGALKELLNPRDIERINPYSGMADSVLEVADVLKIEQSMLFTNYKNAQGITKSFEEYADILNGIVPLQEKDRTEGKLNLMAVRERLKIEKERRKELELIRQSAEAEYDLGLATLQQYDESIDPLQRAVQLRQAQTKYEQDIQDVRMSGLELALDQAESSNQWLVAEKVIEQKLSDIGAGQDAILSEMERRFEVYNNQVADIMANPNFSAATRSEKLKAALDSLTSDLETNFGITKDALQAQFDIVNNQIRDARSASDESFTGFLGTLTNPKIPEITWGQSLGFTLGEVFKQIYDKMIIHFNKISDLAAKIKQVASGATNTAPPPPPPPPATVNQGTPPRDKNGAYTRAGVVYVDGYPYSVSAGDTYKEVLDRHRARFPSFASGGLLKKGLNLVGERGPELVIPQRSGLVLNNSISSRLMSMLTGRQGQASSNVIINVNNPVIRNDNDIRKLAQEISRVQASQFRTEGGRL